MSQYCLLCGLWCVLSAVHPLGYVMYVALLTEEVAELEKKIKQLVTWNADLDKENEEYSGIILCSFSVLCCGQCCIWLTSLRGGG